MYPVFQEPHHLLYPVFQEYPHHLMYLKDLKRLEEFLGDWKVFDLLFFREYSPKLMLYWREVRKRERLT